MNSKRFWGTVMAACLTVSLLAQQHKSVIPYKLVGQKMIVEMLVNGQPRPFVFDTGGFRFPFFIPFLCCSGTAPLTICKAKLYMRLRRYCLQSNL